MLLIAVSLALLVVYAGVKLLIQAKKEILGNGYRFVAWLFIIAGFLTLACTGMAMCHKYNSKMMGYRYWKGNHNGMNFRQGWDDKEGCCARIDTSRCCQYNDARITDTLKNSSRKP
jgi:hypothetical protein